MVNFYAGSAFGSLLCSEFGSFSCSALRFLGLALSFFACQALCYLSCSAVSFLVSMRGLLRFSLLLAQNSCLLLKAHLKTGNLPGIALIAPDAPPPDQPTISGSPSASTVARRAANCGSAAFNRSLAIAMASAGERETATLKDGSRI